MECVTGKILQQERVIADNLEIWLARSGEGDTDWNGSFELPPGVHADTGATYALRLEDGRSGTITVTNVGADDARPHQVGFRGASALTT